MSAIVEFFLGFLRLEVPPLQQGPDKSVCCFHLGRGEVMWVGGQKLLIHPVSL